jgi:hypothetical protein
MALPKIIRDGDEAIARVSEATRTDSDVMADWSKSPAEITFADDLPELLKHQGLLLELVRLAQESALREGAIRRRASDDYLVQVSFRLFSILVDSDLYRPFSHREAQQLLQAEEDAAKATTRPGLRPRTVRDA